MLITNVILDVKNKVLILQLEASITNANDRVPEGQRLWDCELIRDMLRDLWLPTPILNESWSHLELR